MYEYPVYEYGHWHMGAFFDIIFLLLVVLGIAYLVQWASKSSTEGSKKEDSAMDTLKKRYASGEINAEEFAQKKKDLES